MFIGADEHIIIIDDGRCEDPSFNCIEMSILDFRKLENAGVRTVFLVNQIFLHLDWQLVYDRVDDILENTDLKILLPFFETPPDDTWYLNEDIDYANPDVGKHMDEITLKLLEQISNRDRVQLIYAYGHGGEFPWGASRERDMENDPIVSNEKLAEFVVERQKILSSQHNEVWTTYHDIMAMPYPYVRPMIINNALYAEFPDCKHYRMMAAYFMCMTTDHNRHVVRNNPQSKYFVGSEYALGLSKNFNAAMEQGVWGFMTNPLRYESKRRNSTCIEDWMLKEIEDAIERFRKEFI